MLIYSMILIKTHAFLYSYHIIIYIITIQYLYSIRIFNTVVQYILNTVIHVFTTISQDTIYVIFSSQLIYYYIYKILKTYCVTLLCV